MKRKILTSTLILATSFSLMTGCGGNSNTNPDKTLNVIIDFAKNNGNTTVPSIQDYEALGIVGVTEANINTINALVAGLTADSVDSKEEIQALVNDLGVSGIPVISINGKVVKYYAQYRAYNDAGATAKDLEDGILSVKTSGTVDVKKVGKYTIKYSATDSDGHTSTASRTVIVQATAGTTSTGTTATGTTTTGTTATSITFKGIGYNPMTSSLTGKIWLDRNLGASRVCASITDAACYGYYFQWGRTADGYEGSTSTTSITLATGISITANNIGKFITNNDDWTTDDTLGTDRESNLLSTTGAFCPVGYRVPTPTELANEIPSGGSSTVLSIPRSGLRLSTGIMGSVGGAAYLWTTEPTTATNGAKNAIYFYKNPTSNAIVNQVTKRGAGMPIRCIKN